MRPSFSQASASVRLGSPLRGLAACFALLLAPAVFAIGDEIAVAARVFNNYQRVRLPGGKFQSETFTFGDGGRHDAAVADPAFERVTFLQVVRELVGPLARRGYVQSVDPKNTRLLILVFWGTTRGTAVPTIPLTATWRRPR